MSGPKKVLDKTKMLAVMASLGFMLSGTEAVAGNPEGGELLKDKVENLAKVAQEQGVKHNLNGQEASLLQIDADNSVDVANDWIVVKVDGSRYFLDRNKDGILDRLVVYKGESQTDKDLETKLYLFSSAADLKTEAGVASMDPKDMTIFDINGEDIKLTNLKTGEYMEGDGGEYVQELQKQYQSALNHTLEGLQ